MTPNSPPNSPAPRPLHHSEFRIQHSPAFTLIEMLTTVAVLVIIFGLMVSLARDVRRRSATGLTAQLLAKLDVLTGEYLRQYHSPPPPPPPVHPPPPPSPSQLGTRNQELGTSPQPDEQTLRANATLN